MALYPPEEPAIRTQEDVNKAYKNGYKVGFKDGKQRTWVGLTDEEINEWTPEIHVVIRTIEAKLKEKNT